MYVYLSTVQVLTLRRKNRDIDLPMPNCKGTVSHHLGLYRFRDILMLSCVVSSQTSGSRAYQMELQLDNVADKFGDAS